MTLHMEAWSSRRHMESAGLRRLTRTPMVPIEAIPANPPICSTKPPMNATP